MPKTDKELFRIKPLEWTQFNDGQIRGYKLEICGFESRVYQSRYSTGWDLQWLWYATGDRQWTSQYCDNAEEGKQLAEQHWNEYVRQALEPVETNE